MEKNGLEKKWKLDNNKMITSVVVYIHGKDGSATESEHYKLLITDFANKHQATLTIMKNGEHWFHTEDQMLFLDNWIKKSANACNFLVVSCI